MKIDIFAHVQPQKYKDALESQAGRKFLQNEAVHTLFDMDQRLRIMDKYGDYAQVVTVIGPVVEAVSPPDKSPDLARLANDEMAELVTKYPDKFVSASATLPMNNIEAALRETERAIKELRFRGIHIHTPINGRPMDAEEFIPIYELMSQYNLPIWIHPRREHTPDYTGEPSSMYFIWCLWGWVFETTAAMTRLVFGGILERYPNLKFITHHCGAMVPFFEQRIDSVYDFTEMRMHRRYTDRLTKRPIEYFKMFYNDTAVHGSTPALMCAHAFFGTDHLLFGTDTPYDSQLGDRSIRNTIESIERMDIPDSDKRRIFEGNARSLLRLPA